MTRLRRMISQFRGKSKPAQQDESSVRSFNEYAAYLRRRIERGESVIR